MLASENMIQAQLWTLSKDKTPQNEALDPGGIGAKIPYIKSALERATPSSPTLFVFSACGDLYRAEHTRSQRRAAHELELITELAPLEEFLGLNSHAHCLFDTLRPYHNYFTDYDSSKQHRTAIIFLSRVGRNMLAISLVLRIHLPSLSAVALLVAKQPSDLTTIHSMFSSNLPLLRTSPLGILPLISEQRSVLWEEWVAHLYKDINEIEGFKKMAPPEWIACPPSAGRVKELEDVDSLLRQLSTMHVEIGHGTSIMKSGVRLGQFCKEAVDVVYRKGNEVELKPGEREMVLERIRGPLARCEGIRERFEELGERHRGHQNQINNLIAQIESKTSRAVAEINLGVAQVTASDNRIMKTIGFLGLIFLPSTFTSSLWAIDIIKLDEDTNRDVFIFVTLTLTAVVLFCWGIYMRFSRKLFDRYRSEALKAHLEIV